MESMQKEKTKRDRLSLSPLIFKEAVSDLLKVKPPPKPVKPKAKKKARRK
jgi:hypothetical protein